MSRPEILIAGAAGFLGLHLVRKLSPDCKIVAVDNLYRPSARKRLNEVRKKCSHFLEADIRNLTADALSDFKFDAIINLAGQVSIVDSWKDPAFDFDVNARGTFKLLELATEMGGRPRFIQVSSNKVYGRVKPVPEGINELHPTRPDSPYASSKATSELLTMAAHRQNDVDAVVLRCSCIYGPDQFGTEGQGWISHFIQQALAGNTVRYFGDGTQVRDLLHVSDWVETIASILYQAQERKAEGQVFNIGGGKQNSMSVADAWELIADLAGLKVHGKPDRCPVRRGDQPWYVSDTSSFVTTYNWRTRIDPEQGIRDAVLCARRAMSGDSRVG